MRVENHCAAVEPIRGARPPSLRKRSDIGDHVPAFLFAQSGAPRRHPGPFSAVCYLVVKLFIGARRHRPSIRKIGRRRCIPETLPIAPVTRRAVPVVDDLPRFNIRRLGHRGRRTQLRNQDHERDGDPRRSNRDISRLLKRHAGQYTGLSREVKRAAPSFLNTRPRRNLPARARHILKSSGEARVEPSLTASAPSVTIRDGKACDSVPPESVILPLPLRIGWSTEVLSGTPTPPNP